MKLILLQPVIKREVEEDTSDEDTLMNDSGIALPPTYTTPARGTHQEKSPNQAKGRRVVVKPSATESSSPMEPSTPVAAPWPLTKSYLRKKVKKPMEHRPWQVKKELISDHNECTDTINESMVPNTTLIPDETNTSNEMVRSKDSMIAKEISTSNDGANYSGDTAQINESTNPEDYTDVSTLRDVRRNRVPPKRYTDWFENDLHEAQKEANKKPLRKVKNVSECTNFKAQAWYDGTRYECRQCNREFMDSDQIGKHLKDVHGFKSSSQEYKESVNQTYTSKHKCKVCMKGVTRSRMAIRNHVRNHEYTFLQYEEKFKLRDAPNEVDVVENKRSSGN